MTIELELKIGELDNRKAECKVNAMLTEQDDNGRRDFAAERFIYAARDLIRTALIPNFTAPEADLIARNMGIKVKGKQNE